MNSTPSEPLAVNEAGVPLAAAERGDVRRPAPSRRRSRVWLVLIAALLIALGIASLAVAWYAQQRVMSLEQELVRRQQSSQAQSAEAAMLAKQAQEGTRDAAAKVALLEARISDVAIQRGQLDDLIQSLSRSRDENLLVDIDSGIRVALQQTAITGSAEPLVAVLRQSDERLARYNQPRLEGVRRAIARDLDRVRSVGAVDLPTLSIKLDEVVRLIDELPLLSEVESRKAAAAVPAKPASAVAAESGAAGWIKAWQSGWAAASERVWAEIKSLVRVTRIDHPEAMLLAPDQAFFVRENLKLRLMNARLALLSRQFVTAQSDLQAVQSLLERYFDRSSRRLTLANDLLRQVSAQARQSGLPRPDDTLAALSAATAGR